MVLDEEGRAVPDRFANALGEDSVQPSFQVLHILREVDRQRFREVLRAGPYVPHKRGDGVLSPRLLLVSYGGPEALERLRRRLDEVRGRAWQGLRITAVPTGSAVPDGDVVFARPNYTFAVSTRR